MPKPRILIPEPTSFDAAYNQRGWPQYAAAVAQAGGEPVCVPLHASQEEQARLIASAQAILLPGSHADVNPEKFGEAAAPQTAPADSLREAADELLLQDAFNLRKPIFGICYGMQSMNVWRGGSLVQHLETPTNHSPGREVAQAHALRITPGSRLATLIEAAQPQAPVLVNSSHHQAVGRVGDQFVAVAESPEDGTIEAIEAIDPPPAAAEPAFIVGVQWHPERTVTTSPVSRALFRAFVEAAGAWKLQPNGNFSAK